MHGATIVGSNVDPKALIGFSGGAIKTLMAFQDVIGRENIAQIESLSSIALSDVTSRLPTGAIDNLLSLPVAPARQGEQQHGINAALPKGTGTHIG